MSDLELRLAVICRYTHQVSEDHWVTVSSLLEAKEKLNQWIEDQCFENWQFLGGDVKQNKKIIGIFSQNGRFWEPSSSGNEYYHRLRSDREIDISV